MKELINQVEQLVQDELQRANKKFPLFNSAHEGLAVIQEELWEAENELKEIDGAKQNLNKSVYLNMFEEADKLTMENLKKLQDGAIKAAGELIQAAAMCDKFEKSLEDIKADFDWKGFLAGEFCVRFKNIVCFEKFLSECKARGVKRIDKNTFANNILYWHKCKERGEDVAVKASKGNLLFSEVLFCAGLGMRIVEWEVE